jgi:hypothetical protein
LFMFATYRETGGQIPITKSEGFAYDSEGIWPNPSYISSTHAKRRRFELIRRKMFFKMAKFLRNLE